MVTFRPASHERHASPRRLCDCPHDSPRGADMKSEYLKGALVLALALALLLWLFIITFIYDPIASASTDGGEALVRLGPSSLMAPPKSSDGTPVPSPSSLAATACA